MTAAVVSEIDDRGEVHWISKKGRRAVHRPPNGVHGALAPVRVAHSTTMPDTSWMDDPIPPDEFVGWLTAKTRNTGYEM